MLVLFLAYSEFQGVDVRAMTGVWGIDPTRDTRAFGRRLGQLGDAELLELGRSEPEAVLHERLVAELLDRHEELVVVIVASDQPPVPDQAKDSCSLVEPFSRFLRLAHPRRLTTVPIVPAGVELRSVDAFADEVGGAFASLVVDRYDGEEVWVYCSKATGFPRLRDRLVDAIASAIPSDWSLLQCLLQAGERHPTYVPYDRVAPRPQLARALVRALHTDSQRVLALLERMAADESDDVVRRIAAEAMARGPVASGPLLAELRHELRRRPA